MRQTERERKRERSGMRKITETGNMSDNIVEPDYTDVPVESETQVVCVCVCSFYICVCKNKNEE